MPQPIELDYGSSGQSITCTINSLASAAARAATAVDNTTNLFEDALIQGTFKSGSTGTVATGYIAIYAVATTDGGTTYGEGATGTDAAITLTNPTNAVLVGVVNVVANATVYKSNAFSVAAAFGGTLPAKWVLIVQNNTGHALDATAGGTLEYQGVQHQA